jgi:succinate dehydrogenase/fumarate reductase flavoprotein subunit
MAGLPRVVVAGGGFAGLAAVRARHRGADPLDIVVLVQWLVAYVTRQRGVRLITGDER